MEIIQTVEDEVVVVALQGRLDTNTSVSLEDELLNLTREANHKVVINLDELDFISSSGLRVLLTAGKQSKRVSGRIVLCGFKDHVKQVFDVAGFTMLFTIYPTQEEALRGLE
jgi:anti-sigma B factor antagonist